MSVFPSQEPMLHGHNSIAITPAHSLDELAMTNEPPTIPETKIQSKFPGNGTLRDPYVIDWEVADPENPQNWTKTRKWFITVLLSLGTWTVSFCSSAYSGGLHSIIQDLHISQEVAVLGVSLYVLGFGLGPLLFAPLSEVFGRRSIFLSTFLIFTLLNIPPALTPHEPGINRISMVLICRLFSGIFGASFLTNTGGGISDVWSAKERASATAAYSFTSFFGPVLGPIVGGFIAEDPHLGWRFNFWIMLILSVIILVTVSLAVPETYAPVLLRGRAKRLHKQSGDTIYYISHYDLIRPTSFAKVLRISLSRPFRFLFTEPIVTCLALYISVAYATLYALLAAFPIVFQDHRGMTPGQGGLAFLGVGVGVIAGTATIPLQNWFYQKSIDRRTGRAPPEARLYCPIIAGLGLPIGNFWFAWTTQPSIPWIVPILAGVPFGASVLLILQGLVAYLMDTYGLYFASAVGATIVLRSLFAAAFPLFSPVLFDALGDQWASSVFAFLSVVCMPLPIIFLKYGKWIRSKSKWAYHEVDDDIRDVMTPSPTPLVAKVEHVDFEKGR